MAFSQTALTEREYYFTTLPPVDPPASFNHNAPAMPAAPAFPGALTESEQAEVRAWLADRSTTVVAAAAITKRDEYIAHDSAAAAWRAANELARVTQFRWALADAAVQNKAVTTSSSNAAGTESTPPPAYVPPRGTQPL